MNFRELLHGEFPLNSGQLDQLEQHYKLLQAWNARLNLTRIVSLEDTVRMHYWESLFLAQHLPAGALSIADVGSGAGFPGIPIAVFRPECRVTLIESHRRKAVFLQEASRNIPNVDVVAERAESLKSRYDWVVSRAVRPAEILGLPISSRFALLMGESDLGGLPKPQFVTKSPWGNKRILAMFHVEHDRQLEHDRIDQADG